MKPSGYIPCRFLHLILPLLLTLQGLPSWLYGQEKELPKTYILFLLDGSGSMQNPWGHDKTKMDAAKKILLEIVDSIDRIPNVRLGLRIYGHQSPPTLRDCNDTRLEVPFRENNAPFIRDALKYVKPKGITPIAYSLEKAAHDFPNNQGRNIIILLTDGDESCGGDPCQTATMLEQQGIVLKHFVIGMNVDEKTSENFNCINNFFNAATSTALKQILQSILTRVLNQTTLQVYLKDKEGKPTETNVVMSFYDNFTGNLRYNFYHTLDDKGLPDTLYLDPVTKYDLTIHTIPSITRENIELNPKKHNIIELNTPQGYLKISHEGVKLQDNLNDKIKGIIHPDGSKDLLNVQEFDKPVKYLTGAYDIELLTLPWMDFDDITIDQNKTTSIQIPSPGIANIVKKYELYGSIFINQEGRMKKIYHLRSGFPIENIALQPGKYIIVYKPKYATSMHSTLVKEFEIKSGITSTIKL